MYTDCSCVESGVATEGMCDKQCSSLYLYIIALFFTKFIGSMDVIPTMTMFMRSVTVMDVQVIEKKLVQTMEMITAKKKKIVLAERDQREKARGRGEEGGSWWGKMRSVAPSASTENVSLLKADVQALEELSRHLFLEVMIGILCQLILSHLLCPGSRPPEYEGEDRLVKDLPG